LLKINNFYRINYPVKSLLVNQHNFLAIPHPPQISLI
jgi:hypothetical protein